MKKKILLAGATVLLAAAVVTGFSAYSKSNALDILNANVNALADNELGQRYAICYYESRVRTGYTYIYCPDCPNKTTDEKGIGTYTKCFY